MININDFLKRFRSIEDPKKIRESVVRIIKEVTGMEILENNITIKKNIIFLQIESHQKFEIFLKKKELINKIKGEKILVDDFI